MITLDEVKLYLRVDNEEEDGLLSSLLSTAIDLVEGVIRQKLITFDPLPETLKQAVLYCVATMYEDRQVSKDGIQVPEMLDMVKRLTFAYRKEAF